MTCPSCAALIEENHFLRRQLALEVNTARGNRLARALNLTRHEGRILSVLLERKKLLTSAGLLFDVLHEGRGPQGCEDTIHVLVSRIRAKIGHDTIATTRGLGYQLAASSIADFETIACGGPTPSTNLEALP